MPSRCSPLLCSILAAMLTACGTSPAPAEVLPVVDAGAAPDAATTDARSAADAPADTGGADAADAGAPTDSGVDCAGPWSLTHQQPIACLPYPGSLWNKKLPATVMSHLAPSSDAIAKCVLTDCGNNVPSARWGFTSFDDKTGVNDGHEPLYYGEAADPYYVYTSACARPSGGASNPIGIPFHAPSDALYSTGAGDNFFVVWDQESEKLVSGYRSGDNILSVGACPGGGHAGTKSDPCPVAGQSYCAISDWNDPKGFGLGGGDSLGSGGYATHARVAELLALDLPHALYLQSSCTVGKVFPSPGGTLACTGAQVANHGPQGALYFLDYSDAQIAAMNIPDWQRAVITTMSRYGGYVGDTSGGPNGLGGWRMEGPAAYTYAGMSSPSTAFWQARDSSKTTGTVVCALHTEVPKGSTIQCNVSFLDLVDPANQLVLVTGPGGSDTSGRSCAASPGCDISGHIHMADPCVAKALAGEPGACP